MDDKYIIAYVAAFGVVTLISVILQHHGPADYRPFTVLKKIVSTGLDARKRRKEKQKRNAEEIAQWEARPCHACGHSGQFYEVKHKEYSSTGSTLVKLLMILILGMVTFGIGFLFLPFLLLSTGASFAQQCPNCGAERPL